MSLEDKIAELSRSVTLLTGDVQLLTAALKPFLEHLAANREAPIVSREPMGALMPQQVFDENKESEKTEEGNESSTPESGSQSEPDPQASFTYDDVKRATNALSAAKGKGVTIAALAHFGVTRATQLTEAQWGDYVAHCEKAAA